MWLIWRVRKGQAQFNFTFNLPLFRMRLIIGWYLPSRSEKLCLLNYWLWSSEQLNLTSIAKVGKMGENNHWGCAALVITSAAIWAPGVQGLLIPEATLQWLTLRNGSPPQGAGHVESWVIFLSWTDRSQQELERTPEVEAALYQLII